MGPRAEADPAVGSAPAAGGEDVIETDVVVIGAGPVGLFQVFQLGLLEMRAHVVDSLAEPGGQCVELYADKPIYDIPGVPFCTGRTLVADLLKQVEPFHPHLHMAQEVSGVVKTDDGRFIVETSAGTRLSCKVVVVAGGVGSFQPRRLKVAGLDAHEGAQVFHRAPPVAPWVGRHVVIVGNGDAAVGAALELADLAAERAPSEGSGRGSVTLLHRRESFDAAPAAVGRLQARIAASAIDFVAAQVTGFEAVGGRLTGVQVLDEHASTRVLPADALLVLLGLSPRLGPIADWGLALDRKQVVVDTARFETDVPGIFAVGDINTYAGKRKLIVSGFHEATLAAYAAAPYVHPDRPVQLQYTTTSPRLHRLLGVATVDPALDPTVHPSVG